MRIRRVILKKSWDHQYYAGISYLLCTGVRLQGVMGTLNLHNSKCLGWSALLNQKRKVLLKWVDQNAVASHMGAFFV